MGRRSVPFIDLIEKYFCRIVSTVDNFTSFRYIFAIPISTIKS